MARSYHFLTEITFGVDEIDYEVEIEYTYAPGYPETGPSYSSGGEPAVGPEIEIIGATILSPTVGAKPSPEMMEYITGVSDIYYDLAEDGAAQERAARDEAAEYRAELQRDL